MHHPYAIIMLSFLPPSHHPSSLPPPPPLRYLAGCYKWRQVEVCDIIMPIEDFEVQEAVGKGSFGCVSRCVRRSDGEVYAIKQIKIHKLKEKDKQNALNEIRFLASIESPFVVSYKEAFYDDRSEMLCIVMEFANEGDLQGRIKKAQAIKSRIPEEEIWRVAHNVLEGLGKLHEANIVHRDIKPANIFFHRGAAKVGDLNVAKHLVDQFTVTQTGTPYYASPEVWNEEPYNFKSDVWSLGCVLYEMAMLRPPFRADTPDKLFKKIMVGEYEKIGAPYSKDLCAFISKLMTHSQKKRPEVRELLCYPRMMDMKEHQGAEELDEDLLKTIKFPQNMKFLNENLPKPKYDAKCKTSKAIPADSPPEALKGPKSTLKLPLPSLKTITSEKNLILPPPQREIASPNIRELLQARKPKILNKNGSQKLIF